MEPLPIEFHPDAIEEASEAREWYSAINVALGDAFADELETAIVRASKSPRQWARQLHDTRGVLLNRFPYLLVYRETAGRVQVIAVQHLKRRPGYWRTRIER